MKNLLFLIIFVFIFVGSKSYAANMCSSSSSTSDTGTIYDSGGAGNYYTNYEDCGFLIQPSSSPSSITLSFSQFQVDNGWDYLYVYDGTNTSGTLLGTFTGYSLPSSVTATSGSMYLRFTSDYIYRYSGFVASWTSTVTNANLITSFTFDDDWVTNSSLTDQTGSYSGTPSGSVSQVTAAASGSKGDTCKAASFSGGNIDITGLPVSTASGDKTSLSYWMYWDGTKNIYPTGWSKHGLFFGANSSGTGSTIYFGFNTFQWDVTGISSSGLSSGWHHVAAVFTNGSVSNNKLYIDGVLQSISTRTGSVNTSLAVVQSTLRLGGVAGSASYKFSGKLDNLKIYSGTITQSQVTTDMNENNSCTPPSPDTNWQMDEASWNGSANEVLDISDNNNAGTAKNGATTDQTSPAISGSPGTCGYGQFDGSNDYIESSSIYNVLKDTASLSFWLRTTQTGNNIDYLAPGISGVEVNGSANDIFWGWIDASGHIGISVGDDSSTKSTIAINDGNFHHIVLSRNASTGIYYIFIDGVLNKSGTITTGTITTSFSSIGRIEDTAGTPVYFQGDIDELQIFSSVLTQAQVITLMNETHICPVINTDTPATAFNCVENGGNDITGKLYTKTTAQSFSFDIVALRDSSTIETNFADGADHTVTVELVDSSSGGSCSAYSALSPAVAQSLLFTSSDAGSKASASINSSTAYSSVACRVTDATDSPSVVGCSTDNFSIRPTNFTLTSNLSNTGSSSTPKAKAGENFTLSATATTGYTGTPLVDTTKLQAHSGSVQTGTLTGSFNAAVSGVATGTSFVYSEVGSIRFAAEGIYDEAFTSVDPSTECTDDFSNAVVSKKVGCKFGNTATTSYFGRFTPDHFAVTGSTAGIFSNACTGFTYNGQTFSYQTAPTLTVTAYNGLVTPSVTKNYTGSDFNKLSATDFTVPTPTTDTTQLGIDGSNLVNLQSWIPGSATLNDNMNGSLTFAFGNDDFTYLHENNSNIAPFTSTIDLKFTTIKDSDDILTQSLPYSVQASGTSIRFGRLSINNAHGSELSPLSVPLITEYFNGTSFIQNTSDSCTSFTLANDFSISDAADFNCSFSTQTSPVTVGSGSVKASLSNPTMSSGVTELLLSDNLSTTYGPGAGNTGYIEITSNLSNLSWLKYDWDSNSAHDNCPSARATFGIYKGNNKQIYFREVY